MTTKRQCGTDLLERLFTTEVLASFAVSPTELGGLVAHDHWRGQRPVHSWADVQRLHEEHRLWPCFFDGAYERLVASDGQPPAALVQRLFGDAPEWPCQREES